MLFVTIFFFFSSRRRHTRFDCDWSSDVCSSDLLEPIEDASRVGRVLIDVDAELARFPEDVRLAGELGHEHAPMIADRSEEHTSELQSQSNLVCRLLLEKKIK